jgi:ribonuclease BN (tRNA processing enzyme)
MVRVHLLGSGDAFGSGGRDQACVLVEVSGRRILIDCGATALVSMRRVGVRPESIEAVVLTHLHGDHFGGVPFLLLHARHVARFPSAVHVAGPPGTQAKTLAALDALYEGARRSIEELTGDRQLARFEDYRPRLPFILGPATVTALEVSHSERLACHGLRLEAEGRVIACSGDTAWTDTLRELADGADLFIVECQAWTAAPPGHLAFDELMAHLPELGARRVVLTHMGESMLARASEVVDERVIVARDGLELQI